MESPTHHLKEEIDTLQQALKRAEESAHALLAAAKLTVVQRDAANAALDAVLALAEKWILEDANDTGSYGGDILALLCRHGVHPRDVVQYQPGEIHPSVASAALDAVLQFTTHPVDKDAWRLNGWTADAVIDEINRILKAHGVHPREMTSEEDALRIEYAEYLVEVKKWPNVKAHTFAEYCAVIKRMRAAHDR